MQRKLVAMTALAMSLMSLAQADTITNPAAAVVTEHIMLTPSDVHWGECSKALPPGARCAVVEGDPTAPNVLFTYRVKFPANYRIAPHFHPADEHLTIISGTFHMAPGKRFEHSKTRAMTAGSFVVMPKDAPHFAWTESETIVQVHAIGPWGLTYVDAADDPRR